MALDKSCFNKLRKFFGTPDIDMLNSRLNFQIERYVSWDPDPQAHAVRMSLQLTGMNTSAISFLSLVSFLKSFRI